MTKKQKEKQHPKVTDLLLELGNIYLEHGKYDNAISKLTQLIQLEETNSNAYISLSKAYILKKQFDEEAQDILEKTMEYAPENILIYKVLSQMYLQKERLDESALKIYFYVIQQDKQNSESLFQKLLQLSLSKNKFETAQSLIQQLERGSFRFMQALQLFLSELWKNKKIDEADFYLKTTLESEEDIFFQRLFLFNLLKAIEPATSDFKLVEKNLDFLINFVHSKNSIEKLVDIYLFLVLNRLLKKIPVKSKPKSKKQIEEFELFLSGESFSNIWDRALDKNVSTVGDAGVDFNLLWEKLTVWHGEKKIGDQAKTEVSKQEILRYVFNHANCLIIIKVKEEEFQEAERLFSESIQTIYKKGDNPVQGFFTKDGLILFGEHVERLIKVAIDFIKKQSPQENGESNNSFQADIVIHTISLANNGDFNYLFDDLEMALKIFDPGKQLFSDKIKSNDTIIQSQVFFTSAVNNLIGKESTIPFTPSDILAEHPVSRDQFMVYKLCKENTLIKIKNGDIKNIGRYNLIKELRGNEVFVSYKAIDTYLERPVVVKVLRPEFKQANAGFITDEIFLNNTKLLGRLNHPDIALIYDVGKEENLCYFAREYIEGEPLTIPKKINKKIDWGRAVQLGINIAEVLAHPHKSEIVHGRLQPDNIFVIDKNSIKLTDFQIADVRLPVQHLDNGSLNYLTYHAPELIKDNFNDLFSDIYSLGVILYELLTGRNPFLFQEKQKIIDFVLNKTPAPITKHNSELPDELNSIVFKAIEKEPKKRFGSMTEFGDELKNIALH